MKEEIPLQSVVIDDIEAIAVFAQVQIPHSCGAVTRLHHGKVPMTLTIHPNGFWQIMIGTTTPLRHGNLGSYQEAAVVIEELRRRFYNISTFKRKYKSQERSKRKRIQVISLEEAEKILR